MFSGSYSPEDVIFLLIPVELESTDIAQKEKLIQSGKRHYSEMITHEKLPSEKYLRTFFDAFDREKRRFARHLLLLARQIAAARPQEITLVSLARAGTPIGVVLKRVLRSLHPHPVHHYSVSIIRDRGIDEVAVRYILDRHPPASVVFVDGWTGKGVIARELQTARGLAPIRSLDRGLFAVADLCGMAKVAASTEDYLIPSCVLGATVSGLISRSILNDRVVGPGDFHGCLYYKEFEPHDLSRWFVDHLMAEIASIQPEEMAALNPPNEEDFSRLRQKSVEFLTNIKERFGVQNIHHIKPGIGEATRVLLRRYPDLLLLRDPNQPEVQHLQLLAREKSVHIQIDPELPYLAAALIKEME